MSNPIEEQRTDTLSRRLRRDRVFLHNPTVMQGMGLAPLVVVATTAENAWMLAVAVFLLLTPTRLLASVLLYKVSNRTLRVIGYTTIAALLYIGVYQVLTLLFGTSVLNLGIYLPMLVVEPLLIYRFARLPEDFRKATVKGLRITWGYALILGIVGCLREVLALGSIYGISITKINMLPLASTPGGGFILLGVVCAIWRTFANQYRKKKMMQARLEQ